MIRHYDIFCLFVIDNNQKLRIKNEKLMNVAQKVNFLQINADEKRNRNDRDNENARG